MSSKSRRTRWLFFLLIAFAVIFFSQIFAGPIPESTLGIWDVITPTVPEILPTRHEARDTTPEPGEESALHQYEPAFPVVKVIDGDTITISMNGKNETIRLIGINSPESVDPRRAVECYGIESSAKARELLSGWRVRIVPDPTQADRDRYNRLLRYIFFEDGTFFNKRMIEEGFAYEYTYDTAYQYQEDFKAAQAAAMSGKKGLWSEHACSGSANATTGGFADKDCGHFQTQTEAQAFFLSEGGPSADPHRLDVNKDGIVCESLP